MRPHFGDRQYRHRRLAVGFGAGGRPSGAALPVRSRPPEIFCRQAIDSDDRSCFDGGLERISRAMARIALRRDVAIVFPVHRNPNVRRAIEPLRGHDNILLVEPVDYPELVFLLKRCHFVVTDSGGIQEEAPSFGKPVLVTRDTTERPEAMELGLARLVTSDEQRLFEEMSALLDNPEAYSRMSRAANPYGDGQASRRIAERLISEATH